MTTQALKEAKRVLVGMRFRKVLADSNALFEVKDKYDGRTWVVEVVPDPYEYTRPDGTIDTFEGDWVGRQDVMTSSQILTAVNYERRLTARFDSQADWFDGLEIGEVVHYDNGFGNFVRCRVVMGTTENVGGVNPAENVGRKVLQPIALVGAWRSHDLPKRDRYGDVRLGHHADKIVNENGAWRPSDTCVFECDAYSQNKRDKLTDPNLLNPLDLTPPPHSFTESCEAPLWAAIRDVQAATNGTNPQEILARIHEIMKEVG